MVETAFSHVDTSERLKCFTDDELEEMLARRARIEQAKGMLMLLYGVDDDAAFSLLRDVSQAENLRLHDVAVTVAETLTTAAGLDIDGCRRDASERLHRRLHLAEPPSEPAAAPRYRLGKRGGRDTRWVIGHGVLDLAAVPELRSALMWAVYGGRRAVVVDLVNVQELDPFAATLIAQFQQRAVKVEQTFRLASAPGKVQSTLQAIVG